MFINGLKQLKNEKILILGFGREGQDSFLALRKLFPRKNIGIADQKEFSIFNFQFSKLIKEDKNIKLHLGESHLKALKNYDVIIKSPGIPPKLFEKIYRCRKIQIITSQTEIFLQNCPCVVVGVTGTKGKSTTASLIYSVLKKGGIKAYLVGNIGKPALSLLPALKKNSVVVYEMSSFQLTNLKISPDIAVLLNIYKEHLDYYRNFQEYAKAKSNITRHQKPDDYLIYNSEDSKVKNIAKKSKAKKIPIKGKYYQLNMEAARKVGTIFKIPSQKIEAAIKSFKFLPHRLEYLGKFRGVEFYNDSLSTIPETTIEALDYLGKDVQTLMLGGFDRGLSFKELARRIRRSQVKTLILFPTTDQRIWKELSSSHKKLSSFFVGNMETAVKLAYRHTGKDKICLLSPASPSFGLFKDYAERGNAFKKFVKNLGNIKIKR